MFASWSGMLTKMWSTHAFRQSLCGSVVKRCLNGQRKFTSPTLIHSSKKLPSDIIGSDYVVRSPYPDIRVPTEDIYTLITRNFSRRGFQIGLIDGVSGREYSYNEIAETTIKFSSGLSRVGFGEGDVLAIVAPNSPEYAVVSLGALATGGLVTTCNYTFNADQLAYHFKHSNTKIVVTIPAILSTVQEAAAKSGANKIIIVGDIDSHTSTENTLSYESLVTDSGSLFNLVPTNPDDVRVLSYTSGTTLPGVPKGVMLTNRSVAVNVLQMLHPDLLNMKEDTSKVVLGVAPFFHSLVVTLLLSLYTGSKLVTLPKFQPESFLWTVEKYRCNMALLVPPLVLFLAKHPLVDEYDITSLTDILTGAAPIGGDVMKTASQRINCHMIRKMYGLTETSPITHIMPRSMGMQQADSIGCCIQNVKAKVVDLLSGQALPPNKEGEVWLQGPNVMKGYLSNTKATQECITEDGWFKTGDIGHYDESGLFYISDRLKEMIKVNGFQVSPADLEAVLLTHPGVADAAVIGIADDKLGEIPMSFVVKRDAKISEKEIQEFVAGKVSEHECLVGGVTFIDEIPKNASGKILRRVLKFEVDSKRAT